MPGPAYEIKTVLKELRAVPVPQDDRSLPQCQRTPIRGELIKDPRLGMIPFTTVSLIHSTVARSMAVDPTSIASGTSKCCSIPMDYVIASSDVWLCTVLIWLPRLLKDQESYLK
ncbi:hypothetical protein PoB_001915900 [Plakobranchus ocellatus]|uniref:Uncharacterized protein n=1 Tax=Plakobranchus ocellatus TaxID=259542 RepID=A0AAV3ZBD8_9GAST|nr:hypothetical protein PoB_001915900 [Plakobranchus ocellatus]